VGRIAIGIVSPIIVNPVIVIINWAANRATNRAAKLAQCGAQFREFHIF
jgi:hypothetical protein